MDQLILVFTGTVATVLYYILSPVKLSQRILGLLERLGEFDAARSPAKTGEVRSYYVRNIK